MIIRLPRPLVKNQEAVIPAFTKQYKKEKNAIIDDLRKLGCFSLSSKENFFRVRRCLPTGLPALDVICARDINGVYGLPFGKQIELAGKQDSGKTSLALQIAAAAIDQGCDVLWIEKEDSLNEYRVRIFSEGLWSEMQVSAPDYLEQVLSLIKKSVLIVPRYIDKSYKPGRGLVIIWDSVAATPTRLELKPPKKEQNEQEFQSSQIAEFARILSRYERKITKRLAERDVMIIYINQLKDKIGQSWGDKLETYGGNALRFRCAIRMAIDYAGRIQAIVEEEPEDNDENEDTEYDEKKVNKRKRMKFSGINMNIRNKKNKILPPWGEVMGLEYSFKNGFNKNQSLLFALEEKGYASKRGTKYIIQNFDTEEVYTLKEFEKIMKMRPYLYNKLVSMINAS
jgi:recombination protein RecA